MTRARLRIRTMVVVVAVVALAFAGVRWWEDWRRKSAFSLKGSLYESHAKYLRELAANRLAHANVHGLYIGDLGFSVDQGPRPGEPTMDPAEVARAFSLQADAHARVAAAYRRAASRRGVAPPPPIVPYSHRYPPVVRPAQAPPQGSPTRSPIPSTTE